MTEAEMCLLVSFPDQSETFTLGFEAGQIWEKLSRDQRDDVVVHTKNSEVITRMARHFNLNVVITETQTEGWSVAIFSRIGSGLRLVGKEPQP